MSILVTTAIWAVFVAIALWPPFRRGSPGFAVFLATMTINEIPLVLLAVLLVVVADGLRALPTGDPALLPAAVLAAVTGFGLVLLQVRARSAASALEATLDVLWHRLDGFPSPLGWRAWRRGILLPFQRHRLGVQRIRNLSYGPEPKADRLDVFRGSEQTGPRPVLIHLHGGGFVHGGKSREGVTLLNQFAAHGWLCISANYRLGAAGAFPNPLVDVKRVISWVRHHATELGADPSQVFLAGASAGGHLAISAALTADEPRFQPGFEQEDTSIGGVVVLYGYLGPRTSDPTSSPALLARADAPPLLIIHGTHDTMVPAESPRAVGESLRKASRSPVFYVELPYAQHSFDFFASVRARIVADAAEAFLDWARHRPQEPQ